MELCTVEFIEDVPIKAHIGTRHIFARTTLSGFISFDLDSAATRMKGDTIVVILPPETVEIHESTQPGSYEVIDTGTKNFSARQNSLPPKKTTSSARSSTTSDGKSTPKAMYAGARRCRRHTLSDALGHVDISGRGHRPCSGRLFQTLNNRKPDGLRCGSIIRSP